MELEVVYNGSFKYYKVFRLKMKNIQKDAKLFKNKNIWHNRRYKKGNENRKRILKNEMYKKSEAKVILPYFYFLYMQKFIFCSRT